MSLVALTKWVLHFLQEQWRHWIQWIAVSRPFGTHNGKSLSSSVSILYRRGKQYIGPSEHHTLIVVAKWTCCRDSSLGVRERTAGQFLIYFDNDNLCVNKVWKTPNYDLRYREISIWWQGTFRVLPSCCKSGSAMWLERRTVRYTDQTDFSISLIFHFSVRC